MGLDYSIELYFRIEDLEKALLETAKIAYTDPETSIDVTLPNDKVIQMPFKVSYPETDVAEIKRGKYQSFSTAVLFPANPDILDYPYGGDIVFIDGQYYRPMGLGLYVSLGVRYAKFSYTADSTSMSLLLLNSKTIHQRFFELLVNANGLLAFIDIEEGRNRLLSNPQQSVKLRSKPLPPGHPDHQLDRLDRYVQAALRVKANHNYRNFGA